MTLSLYYQIVNAAKQFMSTNQQVVTQMQCHMVTWTASNAHSNMTVIIVTILIKQSIQFLIISLFDFCKLCLQSSYLLLKLQGVSKLCAVIQLTLHHL